MAAQEVENWDDDLDFDGPLLTNRDAPYQNSISSRLSIRSESNAGDDDWQVALAPNDQQSTSKAISSAKEAGIPIPADVPSSALLGGAIKRLGKKDSKPKVNEDWGDDLELPGEASEPLKLKPLQLHPNPVVQDDEDFDWAVDGSLGTRFAAPRRPSRNQGSSASAMSPSIGSVFTAESEEDALVGLELPPGPLDLTASLTKREEKEKKKHDQQDVLPPPPKRAELSNELLDKHKEDFFADIDFGGGDVFDPQKRAVNRNVKQGQKRPKEASPVASRTQTTLTFTDKPSNTRIPRPVSISKQPRLEPVFEAGASQVTRTRRPEPTTTSAQLLRSKRSMPALRNQTGFVSKTSGVFLPGGSSTSRPHQASKPAPDEFRRMYEAPRAKSPQLRTYSRLSANESPDTPTRSRRDNSATGLTRELAARRTITRPAKRRNFGDGTELDTFDDLPTSATKESRFVKQPSSKPAPKALRNQISQSRLGQRDKMTTPLPATPRSPTKADHVPRFARDTAASRIAREQTIAASKPRTDGPLAPRINWPAHVAARTPQASPSTLRTLRKGPQLINSMGKENIRQFQDDAVNKGMHWNASLFRWEGNENALLPFDTVAPPSPPRPALITNISGTQGVQVVGGMVFDPQRMCWLKLNATPSDPMSPSPDEEDDPFKGIEDLPDAPPLVDNEDAFDTRGASMPTDWLVGEEFDLGPEFIRRQREEEKVWRSRVEGWHAEERSWAMQDDIRDIIAATAL